MTSLENICFDLKGKVSLVTGAGQGIGKGIAAIRLPEQGSIVIVADIDFNKAGLIAEKIKKLTMDSSRLFRHDVKIVLVTGSAQGLGKEIAGSFAQCGCSLILGDIVYPEETASQIQKMEGAVFLCKPIYLMSTAWNEWS